MSEIQTPPVQQAIPVVYEPPPIVVPPPPRLYVARYAFLDSTSLSVLWTVGCHSDNAETTYSIANRGRTIPGTIEIFELPVKEPTP